MGRFAKILLALSVWASATGAPKRVLVLPTEAIGIESVAPFHHAARRLIEQRSDLRMALYPEELPDGCTASQPCVLDAGRKTGADLVLALSIAGLGDTYLVRARMYDVRRRTLEREVQESVVGSPKALAERVRGLANSLLPFSQRPRSRRAPWWAIAIAGVIATAAVALPLALSSSGESTGLSLP